jgi:23S rRNA (uracil1939-C5)-methyltransferase
MDQMELTFTGLAYPGRAFGRDDTGRMIFAPFGLQGETARIEIIESHKRWAQGRILEILEPSPERISPRCRHYTQCGGCHYQHIPYQKQLEVKAEIVRSQLERLGDFTNPPVAPTVPSPSPWNYRNHIQFSMSPDEQLGFHAPQSEQIVPIDECHLPDPELSDLWPRLDLSGAPEVERISLRSGADGVRMAIFHSQVQPEIEAEIDLPASVVWLSHEEMVVLAGESHILMEGFDRFYQVSAQSFFQVNTEMIPHLVYQAMELLNPQAHETILDLYAGVGLFSTSIAEAGAYLIAVEESPWAAADFIVNLDEFDHVELFEAPVEITLPSLDIYPHGVLVDPPRSGLGRDVVQNLLHLFPSRLVYVSCDPATLARDAKALAEGGYQLEKVIPIDLFPQTYHIETLSLFLH